MKTTPDHHDAEIILKLYDLRREAVMRESRNVLAKEFMPKTWEEFAAYLVPTHPHNAAVRQVSTYWEMAFGFARHGAVTAELLAENGGEGIMIYAKCLPFIDRLRTEYSPSAFVNAEWITKNTSAGARFLTTIQARLKKAMEAQAK